MSFRSKREFAVCLSKLDSFETHSVKLEQYATPSEIAADWLWNMAMQSEINSRVFLDAGCGPGTLGLGLLLLGARKVYFLDKDAAVLEVCRRNFEKLSSEYELGEAEFIASDISLFDGEEGEIDGVVQNPPFGTKEKHHDKKFLEKAFELSGKIWSMHKWSTKVFVEAIAKDHSFVISSVWRYEFPVRAQFSFHKKPVRKVDVGVWKLEKA